MVLNQGHMYGIYSKIGMDYGVWEGMGYEGTLCSNQPGNTKNLWGIRGYGVSGIWVKRMTTVHSNQ